MSKSKKRFSLVLALLMAVTLVLSACGGAKRPQNPEERETTRSS